MNDLAPLWALSSLNDDVLKDSTPRDFAFDYVDISNVTEGSISSDLESHTFGSAPSRARRLAKKNDIIISTVRTYLRAIAQVGDTSAPRIYSTGFAVLRPDQSTVEPRYLAYVLTSKGVMDEIIAASVGVSYPAIQGSALHRTRVPNADLQTQRAIADYLDRETGEIDAMIAKMDELAETLGTRRQSVIDKTLAPHPPHRLRLAIALSQTGPFGTQLAASEYVSGGIPLINPTHIDRTGITPDPEISVTQEKARQLSRHILQPGDIVLGRKGDVDKSALVTDGLGQALCGSDSMLVRTDNSICSPELLWWFFQSSYCHQQLERMSVGAAVSGLNQNAISQLWMPLPDRQSQQHVAEAINEATRKIDDMLTKVAELKALLIERRSALITNVVTGKKKVA